MWRAGYVLLLFIATPLAKDISWRVSRWANPDQKRVPETSSVSDVIVIALVLITLMFKSLNINDMLGTKGFLLMVWLYEVVWRCGHRLSYTSQAVALISLNMHLSKKQGVRLDQTFTTITRENVAATADRLTSFEPALIFGTIVFLLGVTLLDVVFSKYYAAQYPGKKQLTAVSFSAFYLWFPATLMDIVIAYLFKVQTLMSLYIIWAQWVHFGQVRSIVPMVTFSGIEMGTLLVQQWGLRSEQDKINKKKYRVGYTASACTSGRCFQAERRHLQQGEYVLLKRGQAAPGTILLLGRLGDGQLHQDGAVTISTIAIDGETNDKEKTFTDEDSFPVPPPVSFLHAVRGEQQDSSDAKYTSHPNILRQGARVSDTYPHLVWGKIVGFASSGSKEQFASPFDDFVRRVGMVSCALLVFYTAVASVLAWRLDVPLSHSILEEMFLANNVAIPMTLATMVSVVMTQLHTSDLPCKIEGKKALISFTESIAAQSKLLRSRISGVHLTDKTGTLTQNKMKYLGRIDVTGAPEDGAEGDEREAELARYHIACTSNTVQATNLEPEERAYSVGLGAELVQIVEKQSGWQEMVYTYQGENHGVKRLYLGKSFRHKGVFVLVDEGDGHMRLVVQGSPEAAAGDTGLAVAPAEIPTLAEAHRTSMMRWRSGGHPDAEFPSGAQRNWMYSWSEPKHMTKDLLQKFEERSRVIQIGGQGALDAIREQDADVCSFPLQVQHYMILVDLWRRGVVRVPPALAERQISFWIVTGDGRKNASAIARALKMPQNEIEFKTTISGLDCSPGEIRDGVLAFAEEILALHIPEAHVTPTGASTEFPAQSTVVADGPSTLYFNTQQQLLLMHFREYLPAQMVVEVGEKLALVQRNRPLFSAVCFASETELKGGLVRFVSEVVGVATAFSGDGKNDLRALEVADVGFAFPSGAGHDLEVSASGDIDVDAHFWRTYASGRVFQWGQTIWSKIMNCAFLLLLKQNLTAGLNTAAAASTGMTLCADPYIPVVYQAYQLIAFAIIVLVSLYVETGADTFEAKLRLSPVISLALVSYLLGVLCFGFGWLVYKPQGHHAAEDLEMQSGVALGAALVVEILASYWLIVDESLRKYKKRN